MVFPSDLGNQLADSHARDHLDAILEMHPSFHDARVRLGALLHRLDDLEGARREWERCAEADPEDRRVRAYLAALDT